MFDPSELDAARWMELVSTTRISISATRKKYNSGDFFSSAVFNFVERKRLEKYGINNLYLIAKYEGTLKIYCLTEIGGHLTEKYRDLPDKSNYHRVKTKAFSLYLRSDNTGPNVRAQMVVDVATGDANFETNAKSYCTLLLRHIIEIGQDIYFQRMELGASETRRLFDRYHSGSIQPGTYGVLLIDRLVRATSAKFGILFVFSENKFFAEYGSQNIGGEKKKRTRILSGWSINIDKMGIKSDSFSDLRQGSGVKIDSNGNLSNSLSLFFKASSKGIIEANDSGWLFPILFENDLIGAFLLVFDQGSIGLSESARHLISLSCSQFSTAAKYVFQRRSKQMIVNPVFKSRDTRVLPELAFLMMPFGADWSRSVEEIVRRILSDRGYKIIRADDMFGENIVEDIWQALLKCRFAVADLTGRNPNVYYELGIAHAIGKPTVLLTQNENDIPFDIRYLRHIIYSNNLTGYETIKKGLEGFLNNL